MPFGSHHGISRPVAGLALLALLAAMAAGSPAGAQLGRFYEATGAVSVSVSAGGSTDTLHSVVIDKPSATAQVVRVFVMAASRDGRFIEDGDVAIAGLPIAWERQAFVSQPNFPDFAHNVQAEVTAAIKPMIDDVDEAGPISFVFTEVDSPTIEGVVLVVVFADPTVQTEERTVWLAFGGPAPSGDELVLNFKDPVDPEAEGVFADLGLGIASSLHGDPDTPPTGRVVLVDDAPLTSAAGGQDDGGAAPGSRITVGGRGDDDANPADPLAPPTFDPRFDDELYSLVPFFSAGRTQARINTFAEGFDNLFFAYVVLSDFAALGSGVFLDPETAVNEVGSDHTVTATAIDGEGNPAPDVGLTFAVIGGGPNDGETGTATTGADGTASFTYTGDGGPGTDAIVASFVAQNGQIVGSNIAVKQWVSTLEIALAPEASVNEVESDHTVVAAVSDLDGVPQPGVEVTFEVREGPNAGTTGTATTDDEGMASFTYTGTGGAGVDVIVASFVDPQGDTVTSNEVTKEWILATGVVLEPAVASALVGARHTVAATVADTDGVPQPGVEVTFAVIAGPNRDVGSTAVTGDDGTASFTYAGVNGAGLDAIQASFVDALGVRRSSDLASVEWRAPPLADPRPDLAVGDGGILVARELGTGLTEIIGELIDDQGTVLVREVLAGGGAVYSSPSLARLAGGTYVAVFLQGRPLPNAVVGRFVGDDGLLTGDSLVFDQAEICDFDPAFECPLAHPDVAALPDGGFVAVWEREGAVLGGVFDADGEAAGETFTVAADPAGGQFFATPEVAALTDGSFAVAYRADRSDSSAIRLARFDALGAPVADVSANLFSGGLEARPAIAAAPPDGRPVVLWESPGAPTGAGIFGRVDPEDAGRPEFQVNSSVAGDQLAPALAVEPSGLVAAVWLDAERGVLAAQRFASDLIFVGGELGLEPSVLLGSEAAAVLGRPRVVSLPDGTLVAGGGGAPDGTLVAAAGVAGDDTDPDGGAAVAFTRPTPLAACFEDGRLDAGVTRLECVKLQFQREKRIRRRAGAREGG